MVIILSIILLELLGSLDKGKSDLYVAGNIYIYK